jgi:TolB protein
MPSFSPDSERIVYTRSGSGESPSEIWIVPTLGGQANRVTGNAEDAAWSPDGKRLAFVLSRPGRESALAMSAIDGSNLSIIMSGDADYPFFRAIAWSPDARGLAVTRSSGGIASELWFVPLDGSAPRRLFEDPPGIFSQRPVFTPDGGGIVHSSNRAGATNLWLLALDGGKPVRLTSGPGPDTMPSIAGNGSIAFLNAHPRASLVVLNLVGGETREILSHISYIWAPAFSPAGRELAFSRAEPDGSWHIWMVPVQGGVQRQLTSSSLPEVYPRFTPDGNSVIYHTWSSRPDRIWRVPLAGGPPEPLTPVRDEDDQYGDISPDGQQIAFARTENKITRIYVAAVGGGEARRLTDSASTLPQWSPDGKWIAFSRSRGYIDGIFVIKPDGTGMRRVSETGGWPTWWPDGKQLGYQHSGTDGFTEVKIVSLNGGVPRALQNVRFRGINYPFDISPDGSQLAIAYGTTTSSDIWLLEPQP